jgi:hypothetical protein
MLRQVRLYSVSNDMDGDSLLQQILSQSKIRLVHPAFVMEAGSHQDPGRGSLVRGHGVLF